MAITQEQAQKNFGAVIRRKRQAQNLSQEGFADICGVHRTYMGSIERGERNISLLNICRIATALGSQPSALLSEAGM
ncbi:MAG: helix-turn-helix domain-containing protein [Desulfobacterales bacterium]|nr:helix-turn-helix domain-containing protein [Desulfobacterales bacterium]